MNTKEAVQSLPEYVNVPLGELVESSTNPRKTFDDERLEELAESIRSKGVLSPLLARKVNGHFEIVSGAGGGGGAQRAGLQEVPVRIVAPNDEESAPTAPATEKTQPEQGPF
jgi:ParB family chromosome partitioning protein